MDNSDMQADASAAQKSAAADRIAQSDLLAHHGVRHVSVDEFHYGGYRYSNAADAIAEAVRRPRSLG